MTHASRVPGDVAVRAYIAGILDGEGSIGVTVSKAHGSRGANHTLRVTVGNTDLRLMGWIQEHIGGHISLPRKGHPNPRAKPCYKWSISGPDALALLSAVEPYMVAKRERAILVLEVRDIFKRRNGRTVPLEVADQREKVRQRLHVLNRTGVG